MVKAENEALKGRIRELERMMRRGEGAGGGDEPSESATRPGSQRQESSASAVAER